jgi:aminopeptidase N
MAIRPIGFGLSTAGAFVLTLTTTVIAMTQSDKSLDVGDRDPHSRANPHEVSARHLELDLEVRFGEKRLVGTATWRIERQPGSPPRAPLILDTRDLDIQGASARVGDGPWAKVPFLLGGKDPILGAPLTLRIGPDTTEVKITYRTSPKSSALQWLDPAGTAGGKKPFLFTQSQAIHARSWVPCQDSPGTRVTFGAKIKVPDEGLVAVMAADGPLPPEGGGAGDPRVFRFRMPQSIPPYLIALAVGDLEFATIGARTGVWAEPSVLKSAAAEFADVDRMVGVAEGICGPYPWGRYDLLVLPPSFPFGGMENPKLTFATPTIIAGDRSLVSLVAHELAHSWSGNSATNATWRDFWMNEGFTTYLERRIVEALYGVELAKMERVLGRGELAEELQNLKPADQILAVNLTGRNPDDGFTRVPYEKGAALLETIEAKVGRDRFDAFLKDHFQRHAFGSVTTAGFEKEVRERLFDGGADLLDLHAWLHEPGLPADAPEAKSDRFEALKNAAGEFAKGQIEPKALAAEPWSTQEWLFFLRSLPATVDSNRVSALDEAYGLTKRKNAEIACQWLEIAIRNAYGAADARLEEFLTTIGRRKFLMPLYGALLKTPEGRKRAERIFDKAKAGYHPIARDSVETLLKRS